MNESGLRAAVKRHVPRTIHRQSMTAASGTYAGTPDDYFDGPKTDLFVEFKMLRGIPRTGIIVPELSELQRQWLRRRYGRGGSRVAVVVGLPTKTAALLLHPDEWDDGVVVSKAVPLKEVAAWICECCGESSSP